MDYTVENIVTSSEDYIARDQKLPEPKLTKKSIAYDEGLLVDSKWREGIAAMLEEAKSQAHNSRNDSHQKNTITYFSGALGGYDILAKSKLPELENVKHKSVTVSFADLKKRFSEHTGIASEPYENIRPFMHALNIATRGMAHDNNANMVLDDTLAPAAGTEKQFFERLGAENKISHVQVYAVALMPDQARAQARELGMDEKEAATTARDFCTSFPGLCKAVPDLTLYDKDMHVLYAQKNGKETQHDAAKLQAWELMCGGAADGTSIPRIRCDAGRDHQR